MPQSQGRKICSQCGFGRDEKVHHDRKAIKFSNALVGSPAGEVGRSSIELTLQSFVSVGD